MALVTSLFLLLASAHVLGRLAMRLKQPALAGHMIAGVVLGPSLLGWIAPNFALSTTSDISVLFVVLTAGLEMRLQHVLEMFRGRGVLIMLVGFLVPATAGAGVAFVFGVELIPAIIVALCTAVTALPVALQILESFGMLQTRIASLAIAGALLSAPATLSSAASAQIIGYASPLQSSLPSNTAMLAPPAASSDQSAGSASVAPERLRRAIVAFDTREAPGTIIIDTGNTALYYVLGQGRAIRYGVGVGREGFTWSGVQTISAKAEWPDWHPPAQMISRQPYLPRFMAGGPGNPLGARAMYLGSSEYRIHGTNDPSTIGKFVSSGCIRLTNEDVTDLFGRVDVGTKVVVLPKNAPLEAKARGAATVTGTGTTTVRPTPAQARPAVTTLPSGRQVMTVSTSAIY